MSAGATCLLSPPRVSIREFIDQRALDSGSAIFLVDAMTGASLSFSELQRRMKRVARWLSIHELDAGDSVAYALGNSVSSVIWLLGVQYAGYRAVAINLVSGVDTQAYVLSHSGSRLLITETAVRERVEPAVSERPAADPHLPLIDIDQWSWSEEGGSSESACASTGGEPLPNIMSKAAVGATSAEASESTVHLRDADDDALLMYTSGTTGRPKGVVLSHANLLAGGHNVYQGHQLSAADRVLCVLPLFHINGLCVTVFGPLVSGGSVVMPERFSTRRFWHWINEHRCSWFSVVPTQISYLLHAAESNPSTRHSGVRFGRSASAPLSASVHEQFEACFGIPLIETMGLTETAAQICSNPMPPGLRKSGSPGVAVGDQIRIVDRDLQLVAPGVEGEVLVRGPNVMQRYFDNPSATRESLSDDGWLRTGDLGHLDEQGYLFITGRLKELIIKGGENIAPREIDDALYRHSDVIEAAAFAMPCERYGQRVEAAVALKPGSSVAEPELLSFCEAIVGAFKRPDRIHLEQELPKGPSGKIQRRQIAERRVLELKQEQTQAQESDAMTSESSSSEHAHTSP